MSGMVVGMAASVPRSFLAPRFSRPCIRWCGLNSNLRTLCSSSSDKGTDSIKGTANVDATPNSVEEITGSKEAPISQTGVNGGNGESGKRSGGSGRGPLTWGAVGLLGIAGVALGQYYQSEKEKQKSLVVSQVNSTGKPALGGPWTLVDINGCPKTDKDYHGQYVLLYFGFAHCPDICPSELVKVGAIAQKIEASLGPGTLKPVFVSVDPDRDSLRQLRHYAQDFHQSIEYLTGTKEQVARAAKSYRVYFSKTDEHEEGEDYLVDHSIVLYLLAPDGEFLDFFTQRTTISDCVKSITGHVTSARP